MRPEVQVLPGCVATEMIELTMGKRSNILVLLLQMMTTVILVAKTEAS